MKKKIEKVKKSIRTDTPYFSLSAKSSVTLNIIQQGVWGFESRLQCISLGYSLNKFEGEHFNSQEGASGPWAAR